MKTAPVTFPTYDGGVTESGRPYFVMEMVEGLPITSRELYERLKEREVLVVPGNFFFYGLPDETWRHRDECLRVTFTMPEEVVRDGFRIIAEEVARAYAEG